MVKSLNKIWMTDAEIKEFFVRINEKIDKLGGKITKKMVGVYTNAEMKKILGVGDKLLKKYRDDGLLSYSQVRDKFFYSDKDLAEFLQKNHRDSFL